jgi:FMN phosphatase YigB (HAD superfamily)
VEKYWDCKVGIMTSAPEAKLVLSALYDKYPLVIITNGPPLKQAGKIVRLGLAHFFSRFGGLRKVQEHHFYATAEKGKMKPYPYLWFKSQKDLGYSFSRAVMVGDRFWEDIFGGKRLGMITVKISLGPHAHETIAEAYKKASESEEMMAFFLKEHTKKDVLKAMKPDYTIGSLRRLGDVLAEAESRL